MRIGKPGSNPAHRLSNLLCFNPILLVCPMSISATENDTSVAYRSAVGRMLNGASNVEYYPNGNVKQLIIAKDWEDPHNNEVLKGGTTVECYDNGKVKQAVLARDWKDPDGSEVLKGGTIIECYENGRTRLCTLGADWALPDGSVLKAGTTVECYDNGMAEQFTLAKETILSDSAVIKAGTVVQCYENGTTRQFILANDWKDPVAGEMLKGGTMVECYDNGKSKQFTLAKDWDHPSGLVFAANTRVTFDDSENTVLGTLAAPFTHASHRLNRGAVAAVYYRDARYNIVDAKDLPREIEKGIHIVLSDSADLVKNIKAAKINLWKLMNKEYYRHFDNARDLDKDLSQKLESLKDGEVSAPFEWKGSYLILEKMEGR